MDNSNICSPRDHKCPVRDDDHLADMINKRHLVFNGFPNFFFPYESTTRCKCKAKMYFSLQYLEANSHIIILH